MSGCSRPAGDVAIATGAIRDEGTSRSYLPLEYPAVADADVVAALRQAAAALGISHRLGVTHSKVRPRADSASPASG